MLLALLGLLQLPRGVLGGETATDGTGLLWAKVEGHVLLVLVEQAHVVALLGVDDGQDTGDRLAEVVAVTVRFFVSLPEHVIYSISSCWTPPPSRLLPTWETNKIGLVFMCQFVQGIEHHRKSLHLVQLATGRGDLLDAELAQLSLELAEGLGQVILVLRPQVAGLDLAGRLQ